MNVPQASVASRMLSSTFPVSHAITSGPEHPALQPASTFAPAAAAEALSSRDPVSRVRERVAAPIL